MMRLFPCQSHMQQLFHYGYFFSLLHSDTIRNNYQIQTPHNKILFQPSSILIYFSNIRFFIPETLEFNLNILLTSNHVISCYILISNRMSLKMDSITEHSSQSEQDNLNFILDKQPHKLRKISDIYSDDQKSNFCFTHQTISFTVTRAYINALNDPTTRLYYTKFTPKKKIGAMCIIHGYGQSSDDYIETATYFAKRGYIINMIDLRGFGYSGGYRVNNPIKGTISDIGILLTRCCQNGYPTYILSHGFGCSLVLALLEQNPGLPLAGVIALSPLFSFPNIKIFSIFHQIMHSLSPLMLDGILINNMINPTALTNNPIKIKKNITGVFNYQYVTLKMFKEFNEMAKKVKKDAIKFNYPILMCLGSTDLIQPIEIAQEFVENVSAKQRQVMIFQNGYHQLYNDINAEDMYEHIKSWMMKTDSKKNQVLWNSAKVSTLKTDFLNKKNYVKKFLLFAIAILIGLIALVKKLRKLLKHCKTF